MCRVAVVVAVALAVAVVVPAIAIAIAIATADWSSVGSFSKFYATFNESFIF